MSRRKSCLLGQGLDNTMGMMISAAAAFSVTLAQFPVSPCLSRKRSGIHQRPQNAPEAATTAETPRVAFGVAELDFDTETPGKGFARMFRYGSYPGLAIGRLSARQCRRLALEPGGAGSIEDRTRLD